MKDLAEVLLQLRPYQLEGIEKMMTNRHRWLEFDDMGLGKTVTCLTSFLLQANLDGKRALILCGKNAMGVWQQELRKWYDEDSLIYAGTPAQRKKLWAEFVEHPETHFLITTYAMMKELPGHWEGVFADEIHQSGLLNHKSATAEMFEQLIKNINYVYLITGTPIRQGVIDLYEPLHLVDPNNFSNYWGFVNKYCVTIKTPFGKQIERNPSNVPAFRKMLDTYMVRRLKSEVLKDLPGKQRNIIPLTMTPKQQVIYNDLMEEFLHEEEDTQCVTIAPNQMVVDLRLRQVLCCPRLLGVDDDGAGFEYLSEICPDLLRANRPVVIFTPFRQVIPLLEDLIKGWKMGTKIHVLQGGMTPAAFANSWQSFQESPEKNKIMLCVIKSGASFHATESADCFFLGYEWDFNLNVQAEDRLCRLGQANFVQCNYLLHKGDTVDEAVKDRLNEKQLAADFIIGSEKQFKTLMHKIKQGSQEGAK